MAGIQIKAKVALSHFLDEKEEIIIWQRTHWIFPLFSSIKIGLLCALFFAFMILALKFSFILFSSFIIIEFFILITTMFVVTKIVMDWYFHFYLVTNKKILEVRYSPLFSSQTEGVLLQQVNMTEIDDKKIGILQQFFDFGDVIITFDRPTHSEEFVLRNIGHPSDISFLLRKHFALVAHDPSQIWYSRAKRSNNQLFSLSVKGGER